MFSLGSFWLLVNPLAYILLHNLTENGYKKLPSNLTIDTLIKRVLQHITFLASELNGVRAV